MTAQLSRGAEGFHLLGDYVLENLLPINISLMVFLSSFPESEAECASGDSSRPQRSPFRFACAGQDPDPLPAYQLQPGFGLYGKFHFLLLGLPGLASSVCKRKDILLILVINPLVFTKM